MSTSYIQIQKDNQDNSVQATINSEPAIRAIANLKQSLLDLTRDFDYVHLVILIKEALTLSIIDPILALRDLAKDKITVTLDFRIA